MFIAIDGQTSQQIHTIEAKRSVSLCESVNIVTVSDRYNNTKQTFPASDEETVFSIIGNLAKYSPFRSVTPRIR